ncbi:PP2C family protein-serine/threonine phosphatase [Jeotgalibacillus terrae]|uniref:PP2C family protein-serine/threonine phosphatase n=1 Tax=Jeotgalibacillus terrae TaxID=587735 RepID=A0ABW5ZG54_9BACL|nr:PP2C family protein-serine/threonine phosphatase [Jeotgalibacillus terrae]MBM7577766.1 sigma-B regulation protein RsbU (phosphoserine phosphatase) [Jeotgalibacillus terrae]
MVDPGNVKGKCLESITDNIIQSMAHHIAVIDQQGDILIVNSAWSDYTRINGGDPEETGVGSNYFTVSDRETVRKIKTVLDGTTDRVVVEYPCHAPREKRWFAMNVTPLMDFNRNNIIGAVITHMDVTDRKLLELRQQKDLDMAKSIQKRVVLEPIEQENITVKGFYLASDQLSGDLYAWYKISSHQYGVILLDIMGHGVTAGMMSMAIRSMLEGIITDEIEPGKVYLKLNEQFHKFFKSGRGYKNFFCTGIYMLIDTDEKSISYINAGHPGAVGLSGNESFILSSANPPIGLSKEPDVKTGKVQVSEKTKLLLYTDGFTDSMNMRLSDGESFILQEMHLNDDIHEHFEKIVSDLNRKDDIAIVSVSFE